MGNTLQTCFPSIVSGITPDDDSNTFTQEGNPFMQGKTGERVVIGGIYKCKDHPENTHTFLKGTVFLPCGRAGGHGTVWLLVRKTQ